MYPPLVRLGLGNVLKPSFYSPKHIYLSSRNVSCTPRFSQEEKSTSQEPREKVKSNKPLYAALGSAIVAGSLFYFWYATDDKNKLNKSIGKPVVKIPADSKDIPNSIPYLLVGGGTASFSAFRAIKANDPTAKVLIVSAEPYLPYMRPPLSKEMWFGNESEAIEKLGFRQWNGAERSIFYEPMEFYAKLDQLENEPKGGAAVVRGWTVKKIDTKRKVAILEDGKEIKFEKCLLATGGKPRTFPGLENAPQKLLDKVSHLKTIDDFKKLGYVVGNEAKSFAIIGGGFIGTEMACCLAMKSAKSGMKVHQIFRKKGNVDLILPQYLSIWASNKIRQKGVNVISNAAVEKIELSKNGKQVVLKLDNGEELSVDHVLVAIGSEPDVEVGVASGLKIDPKTGGYLTNEKLALETDVYSAGDVASFQDKLFGRRRVEHHDHAINSGRLAGENMAGANKTYDYQSMFWSGFGPELGFEGVGLVDSKLSTVAVYVKDKDKDDKKKNQEIKVDLKNSLHEAKEGEEYTKGVLFYLDEKEVVVGIILWNVFGKMTTARQVLMERKKYKDLNEVAKLFELHETSEE